MAKKEKIWRVIPEFVDVVTLEQQSNHVVLSNSLSQEQLADFAKTHIGAGFLEQITVKAATDVEG